MKARNAAVSFIPILKRGLSGGDDRLSRSSGLRQRDKAKEMGKYRLEGKEYVRRT
jgi:hypothetical protein